MSRQRIQRKRQRSSRNPWLVPMAIVGIALVAVLFTISYLAQYRPEATPKRPANEYFVFSDLGAEAERVQGSDSVIRVRILHFNLTAKGGNATGLNIFALGMVDPTEHGDLFILNQSTITRDIEFPSPYQTVKEGSYYPIKLTLYCKEAEGDVTLNIPESRVFDY